MKTKVIFIFMLFASLVVQAQSSGGVKKCPTCNKPVGVCEYKGKHKEQSRSVPQNTSKKDKPQGAPTTKTEPIRQDKLPSMVKSHTSNMRVTGGIYSGELLDGKPHGQGKILYTTETLISINDPDRRHAYPDESVEGKFENGIFIYGTYHSVSGDRKLFFGSSEK